MFTPGEHTDKGILNREAGKSKFRLTRYYPEPDLQPFIKRYWVVEWDLQGQPPYEQLMLPHPNVNLVFERGLTRIYGIPKLASTAHLLQGKGKVLGVKFRCAGFYPFWKSSLVELSGRTIEFREVFGIDHEPLEQELLAMDDDRRMVERAERFFRERLPERDAHVDLVNRIADAIVEDRGMTKVDDLVDRFGVNKRTMQRLFSRYVGVSPKWMIQRYRLQEAAELIEKGGIVDWTALSADLGYYDQAHFIKDFKALIGQSPEEYVRAIGQ
ncbi:helix-turn-helix domain-containing protein [Paenibacillus flagellatus]|uniref:AraC family transcriptional regulator n=1 Tax=Paenibacillus flagellatus TaxID=2211139 RepID=A0A2V5KF13_9BACL|nr:helix-turn-helix domain-containing protein [Paenibacillus flagellatus]PYI52650.1 AraC family transcriptional regulator [Paenibacillus flagellatus]